MTKLTRVEPGMAGQPRGWDGRRNLGTIVVMVSTRTGEERCT